MSSGVGVADECVTEFEDMKLRKKYSYLIFKLTDDNKEVVVEQKGRPGETYDDFIAALHCGDDAGQGRWGIMDVKYDETDEKLTKLVMFQWISMSKAKIKSRMVMASTLENLKKKFNGVHGYIQGTEEDEIEFKEAVKLCTKKQ